jgi:hypothetical protein
VSEFDDSFNAMSAEEQTQARKQLERALARMIRHEHKTGREALTMARRMVAESMGERKQVHA